jgi:hypothetical protein
VKWSSVLSWRFRITSGRRFFDSEARFQITILSFGLRTIENLRTLTERLSCGPMATPRKHGSPVSRESSLALPSRESGNCGQIVMVLAFTGLRDNRLKADNLFEIE